MHNITPCLWYDGNAEEAANFYVTLFPDSRVDNVARSPSETPSGPEGMVLVVEFTLAGKSYIGLNGGPQFPFTEAVSFQVRTEDQAETDRLWDALIANGGEESQCGWLKDKFGLSWQVVPVVLLEMMMDPDARKSARVMKAFMQMKKFDIATLKRAYDDEAA